MSRGQFLAIVKIRREQGIIYDPSVDTPSGFIQRHIIKKNEMGAYSPSFKKSGCKDPNVRGSWSKRKRVGSFRKRS
jgi:hypothetical protein